MGQCIFYFDKQQQTKHHTKPNAKAQTQNNKLKKIK